METIYYTGIDQHKRNSQLTTLDAEGGIVRSSQVKNNPDAITPTVRKDVASLIFKLTGR